MNRPSTAYSVASSAQFPFLPGFRKPGVQGGRSVSSRGGLSVDGGETKRQSLSYINGIMMINNPATTPSSGNPNMNPFDAQTTSRPATTSQTIIASLSQPDTTDPSDTTGRYSLARQRQDRINKKHRLPFSKEAKLPKFLTDRGKVMSFSAYFEEEVTESNDEKSRVHRCKIFFYIEDSTIEIVDAKQMNSGMPQGTFISRQKVPKQPAYSSNNIAEDFLKLGDFKLGGSVIVYSREFHIVDCDQRTKEYCKEVEGWGEEDLRRGTYPEDRFEIMNHAKMIRETGYGIGVNRNRKMHEMKEFMEAQLGKPTSLSDLGSFLKSGNKTLGFEIIWDDTNRLYGDVNFFKLYYFLADDTIEIVPIHYKNDGRDQFPKLLKRTKVPLQPNNPTTNYYTWRDLKIGNTINIYSRKMIITKADAFTRDFYVEKSLPLGEDLILQTDDAVDFKREVPPYNGFGSEEDSLRSCGVSSSFKQSVTKEFNWDKRGLVMRFNAKLLSKRNEDKGRRFVVQFFMEDDTIAIREPPIRNSGIIGGNFLRRQPMKHPDNRKFQSRDMFVGNVIEIACHKFALLDADDFTYRLMENDEYDFPNSSFKLIYPRLQKKKAAVAGYFVHKNQANHHHLDIDDVRECFKACHIHLNKQEMITVFRKMDKRGKKTVSSNRIIKLCTEPMERHVRVQSRRMTL